MNGSKLVFQEPYYYFIFQRTGSRYWALNLTIISHLIGEKWDICKSEIKMYYKSYFKLLLLALMMEYFSFTKQKWVRLCDRILSEGVMLKVSLIEHWLDCISNYINIVHIKNSWLEIINGYVHHWKGNHQFLYNLVTSPYILLLKEIHT